MLKYFTIGSRIAFGLLGASFVLALIVSFFDQSFSTTVPRDAARWDAIVSLRHLDPLLRNATLCYLIERKSNRCETVPLPPENRWGQMSISPWPDAEGNTEAVCEALGDMDIKTDRPFWGLARLQLPEGNVIDKVNLDLLPTGRPCWVPARPGRVLFAAGDGRLYFYDFAGWDSNPGESVDQSAAGSNNNTASPVSWKGTSPLGRSVVITDPVWPSHPRLRSFVFASVFARMRHKQPMAKECWLRMSTDGDVIEESGLLRLPREKKAGDETEIKCYPTVEMGRDGTVRLAYLRRNASDTSFQLEVVRLELDHENGHPRVPDLCTPRVLESDCAQSPPLFSSDGMSLYIVSSQTGLLMKRQVDSDSPFKLNVAIRD